MNSIIETRRAQVRWEDEDYVPLQEKLKKLIRETEEIFGKLPSYQSFRWLVTETILHDEERECVPDDYPVLLIEVQIIHTSNLWVIKRFKYTIVIDLYNTYFVLDGIFYQSIHLNEGKHPSIIAESLKK